MRTPAQTTTTHTVEQVSRHDWAIFDSNGHQVSETFGGERYAREALTFRTEFAAVVGPRTYWSDTLGRKVTIPED